MCLGDRQMLVKCIRTSHFPLEKSQCLTFLLIHVFHDLQDFHFFIYFSLCLFDIDNDGKRNKLRPYFHVLCFANYNNKEAEIQLCFRIMDQCALREMIHGHVE